MPFNVWGTDMIVRVGELRRREISVTLAFTEIVALSREEFSSIVIDHPQILRRVRRAAVLLAVQSLSRIRQEELHLEEAQRDPQVKFVHKLFEKLSVCNSDKSKEARLEINRDHDSDTVDILSQDRSFGTPAPTVPERLDQIVGLLQSQEVVQHAASTSALQPSEGDKLAAIESKLEKLPAIEAKLEALASSMLSLGSSLQLLHTNVTAGFGKAPDVPAPSALELEQLRMKL